MHIRLPKDIAAEVTRRATADGVSLAYVATAALAKAFGLEKPKKGSRPKLDAALVAKIDGDIRACDLTYREIAKKHGVSFSFVQKRGPAINAKWLAMPPRPGRPRGSRAE